MRQLLIVAVLAIAAIARPSSAQTPEPLQAGPHGEPVHDGPHGEPVHDGPHGEPVHDGPYGQPVPPDDAGVPPADAPTAEPPKTESPKSQPPNTQPPSSQPPSSQPPSSQPPNTQPPKTQPVTPGTGPVKTQPATPVTGPGKTQPVTPEPPKTQPVTSAPPKIAPPIDPTVQRLEPMRAVPTESTLAEQMAAGDIPTEGEIKKIVVEGNEKTTSDTVVLIARIDVGDHWSSDMVDVVKSRLVSSGLFKDIEVYWTKAPGGVEVHILAQDKHSWVIAPAFYNQPTNTGGGIGFGENNLFGKNQKLLLYGQVATGDSFFIGAWLIPNLGGTRFYGQLDTYLKSARNFEYNAPDKYLIDAGDIHAVRESRMHYLNFGGNLGIELFRGVKIGARLRAAWVSYPSSKLAKGATIDELAVDPANPTVVPNPGGEGWDISNEWSFTIDRRANWYGVQTGKKLSVALERSVLGSDFHYWLLSFYGFRAWQVLERHNLVLKANVSYGHNLPFQQELLTGGTSMRGWLNNEFRGNFRTLVNAEYSVPVFTIHGFGVRALAFWDSAYTTFTRLNDPDAQGMGVAPRNYLPNSRVRGLDGFRNSVGVGTRFYLRQIVLPLLGLDFGYGLEARDLQIYLAIGLTD